jgi:hypothetical protein
MRYVVQNIVGIAEPCNSHTIQFLSKQYCNDMFAIIEVVKDVQAIANMNIILESQPNFEANICSIVI